MIVPTKLRLTHLVAFATMQLCVTGVAKSAVVIIMSETGSGVLATYTGNLNTASLIIAGSVSIGVGIFPSAAILSLGRGRVDMCLALTGGLHTGLVGPSSFGLGNNFSGGVFSGDPLAIRNGSAGDLHIPQNYVSGTPIAGNVIWTGQTLNGLGVTEGRYVWSWGEGANSDSISLTVVPEASVTAQAIAVLVLLAARRKRKKVEQVVHGNTH